MFSLHYFFVLFLLNKLFLWKKNVLQRHLAHELIYLEIAVLNKEYNIEQEPPEPQEPRVPKEAQDPRELGYRRKLRILGNSGTEESSGSSGTFKRYVVIDEENKNCKRGYTQIKKVGTIESNNKNCLNCILQKEFEYQSLPLSSPVFSVMYFAVKMNELYCVKCNTLKHSKINLVAT